MSNPYYTHGSFPSTGAAATSASMRAELDLISAAFDKLPTLTSNANKFVVVNSTATGLTTTSTLPIASVNDSEFTFQDTADNTRKFQFAADAITPGATRLFTMPDADTTLVGTGTTQTLTNKTLTAPVIATIVNTGTLTLPTSTDTLVGRATTDTLTNKTLTNPTIGTILNTGTLTLPTSTDTLVGRATTDTLTNKTISGANNSLTNIGNSSLTNSAVTIGSSSLSLGGTLTTLAGVTISGASNTLSNIANASLTNSGVTFNGVTVALGASGTITASTTNALTIGTGLQLDTGTTFNGGAARTLSIDSTVATLSGSQTLSNKTISGSSNTLSNIANASLTNSSITIGSSSISLGSTASTISGLTSLSATGLIMTANAASSTAISAIAQSAGTVTVTAAGHGLTSGDLVSIDGVADYTYTGLVTVNVTNANVFTYSRVTTNSSSSGGYVTKLQGTWASYSGGTGPAYRNGPSVYEANSQMPALRVTQTGNGYAFIVEDATNPDTSAFIISNAGDLTINTNKFTVAAATGNTAIAGTTSFGGNIVSNILFTDATYDIGASGANRPRDLFLSRNLVVGGTLTLAGGVNLNGNVTIGDAAADTLTVNSTITSNLIFTDNTYDIGASGATRPRNLYLAGNAVLGTSTSNSITLNGLVSTFTLSATTNVISWGTNANAAYIQSDANYGLFFGNYAGSKLAIKGTNGYVGVGTTNPDSLFTVDGSTSVPMRVRTSSAPDSDRADLFLGQNTTTDNRFNVGTITVSGGVTLQGTKSSAAATKVNLILQPDGGKVGIAQTQPYSLFSNIASSPGWGIASDAISWQATGTGYAASLVAAPASGYSYGLRVHTTGSTDSDSILALTGGAGTGAYAMIVTGSGKAIIGPTGTATYRLRVYDTTDCAIGIDGYSASAAAQLWMSSGNGTTSPAYAYISHKNNKSSPMEWRVGTYGSDGYTIYNQNATSIALNIDSGNLATFGPSAKTDAKLNVRYNAGPVIAWGGVSPYDNVYGYLSWTDGGTYSHALMYAPSGKAIGWGVNGNSGTSPDMYLNVSGYLSIGAGISPNSALHVKKSTATIIAESTTATANADIHFKSTAQVWGVGLNMQYTGGQLEFYDYNAGSNRAFFDTQGILTVAYQSASQRFIGTDQTVPTATYTALNLAVNKFTQNITYTANGRFTATAAGKYLVTAWFRFQSGTGFAAELRIQKNASYYTYEYVNSYTLYQQLMCSVIIDLAYGDYVDIESYQNSGSGKDMTGNSQSSGAYIYKLC